MSIRHDLKRSYSITTGLLVLVLLITTVLLIWKKKISEDLFEKHQPLLSASYQLQQAVNVDVSSVRNMQSKPLNLNPLIKAFYSASNAIDWQEEQKVLLNDIANTLGAIHRWHWRIRDYHTVSELQEEPLRLVVSEKMDNSFNQISLLINKTPWKNIPDANALLKLCADIRGLSTYSFVNIYDAKLTSYRIKQYHETRQQVADKLTELNKIRNKFPVWAQDVITALIQTDHELRALENKILNPSALGKNFHHYWEQEYLLPLSNQFNNQMGQFQQELAALVAADSSIISTTLMAMPWFFVVMTGAAVLLSALSFRSITLRIVHPTRALVDASRRLVDGLLNEDIPIERNDELGQLTHSFNQMRQAIQHKAKKLEESEHYLSDIFNGAGDAIICTNRDGLIEVFNPAAELLFGYTRDEVIGENIRLLVPEDKANKHDDYIRCYLQTKRSLIINEGREVNGIDKEGKSLSLYIKITHLKNDGQDRFIAMLKDHRAVVENRQNLESIKQRLEQRTKLQTQIEKLYKSSVSGLRLDQLCNTYEMLISQFLNNAQVLIVLNSTQSETTHQNHSPADNPLNDLNSFYRPSLSSENHTINHHQSAINPENWLYQSLKKCEPTIIENLQHTGLTVAAGQLAFAAKAYVAVPLIHEQQVIGGIEVVCLTCLSSTDVDFITQAAPILALELSLLQQRETTERLLEQTTEQAMELQNQQEELTATNQELQSQAQELRASEEQARQTNQVLAQKSKELNIQQQQLQSAYRYKSEFLANMSHELRTPLNSILLLCDLMLKDKSNNAETLENADVIQTAGNNLLRLINDILDLAKIETGRMTLRYSQINSLDELIDPIIREIKPLAKNKGLIFTVECSELSVPWVAEPVRIEQILRNLLSNAVKFTEKGSVRLHIRVEDGHQHKTDEPVLVIVVEDTGPGIPEAMQEQIFHAFVQVDGTNSRCHGGTGLGLAITKELVNAMSGTINVECKPAHGSCFTVVLPKGTLEQSTQMLEPQAYQQQTSEQHTLNGNALNSDNNESTKHLLILDDDKDTLQSLAKIADNMGFKATLTTSLTEARQRFETQTQWAGCVLDLTLGDGDSRTLINELNLIEQGMPIIIFSGKDLDEEEIVTMESQGCRIIYKGQQTAERFRYELSLLNNTSSTKLSVPGVVSGQQSILLQTNDYPHLHQSAMNNNQALYQNNEAKQTVLLVDDDTRNCFAISKALRSSGYRVLMANNGKVALKRLEQNACVDIVLMDTMMPEMDGLECIRHIRKKPSLKSLPIISLTAKASQQDREECLAAGANDYLSKPARLDKLETMLKAWLN